MKFKDTHLFSPAASKYKEYGYYTDAIPDTREYYEFWDEEHRRCVEGHKVNRVEITGYHYFYLNYCPIDRAVDAYLPDGTKIAQRERTFPAFYDGDYDYFHTVDKCRKENKHLAVLKGRRKGYSYKSGSMMARNYFHVRNSKNFVFAEQKEYLIGEGILSKAWDFISFIDDNTAWTQPRLTDKEMHKQSGYKKRVNGADVALGMKSQIIGVSLKDNPDKVRGMGSKCGYFVPIYQNLDGFIDDNGNSDKAAAILFEEEQREKKRNANDPKALDQYVAEHPFSPQEATLQVTANLFDVNSLKEQYNKVKANNLENEGTAGVLYYDKDSKVGFRPSPDVYPVYKFPHRKGDKTKGAVVVYETPFKNKDGDVPHNLYIICHDPYAQSGQGVGESLGASYVIKRPNNLSKPGDIIVASYVGRPQTQDEYNRNLFMLADFYNAKIGFENDRGELIAYAKRYRKLHKLQEEFEMLDKRELRSKTTRRQFGMHMTQQRKRQGELYIRDWLISPRSTNEEGVTTLNMHKIYDPALLQELIKFNHKGNFDRVMALMIGMYHTRELYNREVVEITTDRSQDDWFNTNYK